MSRLTVRWIGAACAAAMAVIYFAIGSGVVQVVEPTDPPVDLLPFGALAGGAFLLGALLLATLDRRVLWILGAAFQIGVAIMYVVVSQQRTPPFEVWGITLRIIQIPLLAVLAYLALRAPLGAAVRPIWRSPGRAG
jgi:hypothetical protein